MNPGADRCGVIEWLRKSKDSHQEAKRQGPVVLFSFYRLLEHGKRVETRGQRSGDSCKSVCSVLKGEDFVSYLVGLTHSSITWLLYGFEQFASHLLSPHLQRMLFLDEMSNNNALSKSWGLDHWGIEMESASLPAWYLVGVSEMLIFIHYLHCLRIFPTRFHILKHQ